MFTGPVGPVEVFFYWPEEAVLGNFYWPGASKLLLALSLAQQPSSSSPTGRKENPTHGIQSQNMLLKNTLVPHFDQNPKEMVIKFEQSKSLKRNVYPSLCIDLFSTKI